MGTRDDDFVEHLFVTSTHSYVLFFSNKGKVYRVKGYEIPEAGRTARGTAIVNLIDLPRDERVQTAIPIKEYDDEHYLVMATKKGIIKKTPLSEYDSPRHGLIGINLDDDDELVGVRLTDGSEHILLVTAQGQADAVSRGHGAGHGARDAGRHRRAAGRRRSRGRDGRRAARRGTAGRQRDWATASAPVWRSTASPIGAAKACAHSKS